MPQSVTILGDGAMSTVCSILLNHNGHDVTMWGAFEASIKRLQQDREQKRLLPGVKVPEAVRLTACEADCFNNASLIVSAVPTQYMRTVWTRLRPYIPAGVPIVSVSKGIENHTLCRPTEIIAQVLGNEHASTPMAALSGPNIAGEIARRLAAMAVVGSLSLDLAVRVQQMFSTQWFRVYTNPDLVGIELAGATKNVIAIAAGILDGLGAGNNSKAALVSRGLVEITRLGIAMGAQEATFSGLAGLGDLITTCVSPEGRNRSVGEQIGKGRNLKEILASSDRVAEGVPTTASMVELADRHRVNMPITRAVHAVLFEGMDPKFALIDLMTRDPKPERTS